MAEVTPDRIFQVANGFMAAKHLFVANEVGLFEQLTEGPATLDELAQRVGIPRRTLRILADAMVALGFVEREGERYQNGPVAASFLSGRPSTDLRPVLRVHNHFSYPRWLKLEETVRTGQPMFGELAFTVEQQRLFSEGVAAIQAAPAQALPTAYDFRRHRRVLDLGGGTGSWLVAVLRAYSEDVSNLLILCQIARPNSCRLMKSPITRSCICFVLEKQIVRRTNRLIRVRKLMCLLSIFCVFSFPTLWFSASR